MQHNVVVIELTDRDLPHGPDAARHLPLVQSAIVASLHAGRVTLEGRISEASLRRAWQLALLNERLFSNAAGGRTDVLKALVA